MSQGISVADVFVVVLNYDNADDTLGCLCSLVNFTHSPGKIIVVDNGSRDDSLIRLEDAVRKMPVACVISLDVNMGYSAGNNAGIRIALEDPRCRAIWILNNDTEPDPNSLQRLCDTLNACPQAGMAGSTLVYAHDRELVQCAAGFAFNKCTGATPALHGNKRLSTVLGLDPMLIERRLSYLCGASMLVRREVFECIGCLAEEYFLYYEDAEFGIRARRAGYALTWSPESIVFHKEGGSTGANSLAKRSALVDYLALRNRIYLVRKYFPVFVPAAVLSYGGVLLNRLRRNQLRRFPLVIRALADGLRGRMGKPKFFDSRMKRASKILFLTLRADFGGGPEHLWQLLKHAPASVMPYVACPEGYPYYERYRQVVGNAHIFTLPHRLFSLRKLWHLRRFCREHGITVLHSHGKGAGLYARPLAILTGLPCVYTFHGVHINEYSHLKKYIYRLCERFMSLFTQVGIAVSEGERAQITAEGLMPASKLRLIPNGVDVPDAPADVDYPLSPPFTVVTLSRFDYQKNSMFLIDIARTLEKKGRLGEFQIVAVGDGMDRQGVANVVQTKGWDRSILCPGASIQPRSFFEGAFCYLSTSRWEGMPLAVLEAMGHGLPVVASDVVGNKDVVRHGVTGFLYLEGDAAAAADALCRLADAPALHRKMGLAAHAYVLSNHSMEEMVAKTFDVLKEVSR